MASAASTGNAEDPSASTASTDLALRLRAATQLARERGGRALGQHFRPREDIQAAPAKKEKVCYERRVAPKLRAWYSGHRALNNERGVACRGQGKRHQNPAAHSQPAKSLGGRQAKWSNPNPTSSKRNFKQRL